MDFSLFIVWIVALAFSFFCGVWVLLQYLATKSARVGYFAIFLLTGIIGMTILVVTFYLTKGTLMPPYGPWGFLVGAVTKTVGLCFLIRLLSSFLWPKASTTIFWIAITILAIFTLFGLNSLAGTGSPMPFAVVIGAVVSIVALITIPALMIIILAIRSTERVARYRGSLLGIGFLFFGVSIEGTFGFAGLVPFYFNNIFVATATILFFTGILWTLRKEKPEVVLPHPIMATTTAATGADSAIKW